MKRVFKLQNCILYGMNLFHFQIPSMFITSKHDIRKNMDLCTVTKSCSHRMIIRSLRKVRKIFARISSNWWKPFFGGHTKHKKNGDLQKAEYWRILSGLYIFPDFRQSRLL